MVPIPLHLVVVARWFVFPTTIVAGIDMDEAESPRGEFVRVCAHV